MGHWTRQMRRLWFDSFWLCGTLLRYAEGGAVVGIAWVTHTKGSCLKVPVQRETPMKEAEVPQVFEKVKLWASIECQ